MNDTDFLKILSKTLSKDSKIDKYFTNRFKAIFDKKEDFADGLINLIQTNDPKNSFEMILIYKGFAEKFDKLTEFKDTIYLVFNSTKLKEKGGIKFQLYQLYEKLELAIKDSKEEIERLNKTASTTITGFKSSLKAPQIQTLFDQIKDSYIDNNTNPDHFKAIFKDEPLPDNCKILWLKTNVLLAYFIKKLFHFDNYFNVWVKAESIFIKDKEPIKNLRQSETNNPHPKGYEEIDIILKNIYSHLP